MSHCIFCGTPTNREPVEHIVAEGLVGEQPFQVSFGSIIAERASISIWIMMKCAAAATTGSAASTNTFRINWVFYARTSILWGQSRVDRRPPRVRECLHSGRLTDLM